SAASRRASTCFQRSASIGLRVVQLPVEPGLGLVPFADHGDGREPHHLRGLFDRESSEETEFYYPALSLINSRQTCERFVQSQQVRIFFTRQGQRVFERDVPCLRSLLDVRSLPGKVHEDAAHHPGRDAEEVSAVLPADGLPVDETQIGFV